MIVLLPELFYCLSCVFFLFLLPLTLPPPCPPRLLASGRVDRGCTEYGVVATPEYSIVLYSYSGVFTTPRVCSWEIRGSHDTVTPLDRDDYSTGSLNLLCVFESTFLEETFFSAQYVAKPRIRSL